MSGGTNSTIAWFLSPDGEISQLPIENTHYVFGVLWLTDDYIATAENAVYRTDGSQEGSERLTIYDARTLEIVSQFEAQNICCGPLVKLFKSILAVWSGFDGRSLSISDDQIEGIPFVDHAGSRLYVFPDYLETMNVLESADGAISLELAEANAQAPNWRKQSGTGTDVKYSGSRLY